MTGRDGCNGILTLIDDVLAIHPEIVGATEKGQGRGQGQGKVRSGRSTLTPKPLATAPEGVLAEQVRTWADQVAPGVPGLADAAVARALMCYAGGASVSEACREARRLLGSWLRHPSRGRRCERKGMPIAS